MYRFGRSKTGKFLHLCSRNYKHHHNLKQTTPPPPPPSQKKKKKKKKKKKNSNFKFRSPLPVDLFTPILEGPGSAGGLSREHQRNLYIVAGVLAAIVLAVVLVLVVCFCRVSGAYRKCFCCWNVNSWMHYHKHRE